MPERKDRNERRKTLQALSIRCLIVLSLMISSGCHEFRSVESGSSMDESSTSDRDAELVADLATAEAFIDAFYSWNAEALSAVMTSTEPTQADRALYYQAWAEGGHYRIQKRRPCAQSEDGRIECAITVTDDIGAVLGYVATDVFRLSIAQGSLVGVEFDSDDPPIFEALFEWMTKDRPEVFAGPCRDLFSGGQTPGPCVRAVVQAAKDFVRESGGQP